MGWLRDGWTWGGRLLRFAGRVGRSFLVNRGILLAGGVGYNALLSLVPFLTVTVAMLSQFFDEATILAVLQRELALLVPGHADALLLASGTFLRSRASTSVGSVAVMLFFSSIAFRMLEEAVATIFHTTSQGARRSFWVSALMPYLLMLVLMAALFFLTLVTTMLDTPGPRVADVLGLQATLTAGVRALASLAGFAGLVILFAGIYRVLPVVRISTRRALVGGLCAAVLWRLVGLLLVWYFTRISMVSLIYGSLGTVVVVLLFLEIAFIIVLLGAQVIAELRDSAAAGLPWYEQPRRPQVLSENGVKSVSRS